jgi:multiple sugar transport system substrate-binding protein
MSKLKKVLCILLTGMLIIALIAGCSSKNGEVQKEDGEKTTQTEKEVKKEPVEIAYWYWDNTNDIETDIVKKFNSQNPDIVIKDEQVGWDIFNEKLMTAVSAGDPPDVSNAIIPWLPSLIEMDAIITLDEYIEGWGEKDNIYDSIYDAIRMKPEAPLYGTPNSNIPLYLYCRVDLFEEAGAKLPETLDEFYEAAEKLTKDTNGDGQIDQYAFGMRGARGGHHMWAAFVMSEIGGGFLDNDGNPRFNTPQTVAANERYIDLYKNGYTPRTAPSDGFAEIIQNMEAGVTAMLIHHVSTHKQLVEKFGDNIIAIPLPKGAFGRWVSIDPTAKVIFTESKNKDEAVKFALWYAEAEQNDMVCKQQGQVPINKKTAEDNYYQDNPFMKVSIESMADAYTFPAITQMAQWVESVWPTAMQRALLDGISSQEMMDILEEGMK